MKHTTEIPAYSSNKVYWLTLGSNFLLIIFLTPGKTGHHTENPAGSVYIQTHLTTSN